MSSTRQGETMEKEEEEEKVWRTAWLRGGGSLSEVTWIGRDVLGWCSAGLHLVFLDVTTNRLRLVRPADDAMASGVSCLAGHLRHKVFAFADKHVKPRIHVYAYPSMTKISECLKGTSYVYLASVFAGDFFVSLGSMFGFRLSIWSWRTGEKIASVHTPIHDAEEYGQTLRVNYSTPLFVAQIGNKSGRLITWEATICDSTVLMHENDVVLPKKEPVKDVAWCPDLNDLLAIVDRDGHVYLCDSKGNGLRRIVQSQRCVECVDIEPVAVCWYRGGIVLRTTFCQICYYRRRDADFWAKVWLEKIDTHPCALTSHPYRDDRVFFVTIEGHVVQVNFVDDLEQPASLAEKQFVGGKYRFVDFVRPWDDHVVAMDGSMELSVIRMDVGVEVSRVPLALRGRAAAVLSHPEYPLVVVGSDEGEVSFVSFINCRKPAVLGSCWVQLQALDLLKFSTSGRFLATCQKITGSCFLFDVSCAKAISIVAQLNVASKVVDVMLFDTDAGLRLFVLQSKTVVPKFGYKLSLYFLPSGASKFQNTLKIFLHSNFYQRLHCVPSETGVFVGSPYLTKKLTYFRTNDWKSIILSDVTSAEHHVRQIEISISGKWLVTSAADGLVVVRDVTKKRHHSRIMTHHPSDLGVSKVIIDSTGDSMVALGADGSLVAVRYHKSTVGPVLDDRYENLQEFGRLDFDDYGARMDDKKKLSTKVVEVLSQPVRIFDDSTKSPNVPWTVWKEQKRIEEETKIFADKKESLVQSFTALKNRVVDLLDKNEISAESKKLPTLAFELDNVYREKKIKRAKDEREEVRHELGFNMLEMDRVSGWIRSKFWESQKILGRSIFGIFDDTEVTNYAMSKESAKTLDVFEYARVLRDIVVELTGEDNVFPWDTRTDAELRIEFDKQSKVRRNSTEPAIDDISHEGEPETFRNFYEGMTTHRFIEPCALYCSQFKIYAYSQFVRDNHNIVKDTMRLREHFNKHFADIQSMKEREMSLIHERVDRVLFIASELESMFNEYVETKATHPEWQAKEIPESIVEVTDRELTTRPYVTRSYQDILDKQTAEEERARLARLADDFRERALQAMMDGVLEVRWEDIIKKDPEKPECLAIGKSPDDYTEGDALAVKTYQQELDHLTTQRQKYQAILRTDYAKVNATLDESIEKFNSRLLEFHLLKIQVESAIQQLNLRYVRYYVRHVHRLNELKEANEVKARMNAKYQESATIEEEIQTIKNVEQELLSHYEDLQSRDKLMEKKAQSEFPGLGKKAVAGLFQQYRRRPRVALKNTSAIEGLDLGRSIKSRVKLPYVTSEGLDYMRHLDILDVHPASLHQSIETPHWESLVHLRRLKIDHELKLRSVERNLGVAASIVSSLSLRQSSLHVSIASMGDQLKQSRVQRTEADLNTELQLVLKMGQVEDEPLVGSLDRDLQHAIVVPRRGLDRVNEALVTAGGKKIREIERNLEFSRGILLEEWEHRCMGMRMDHMATMLHYVRMANVTREVQEYLRRKRIGKADDKTEMKLQRSVEGKRRNLEKLVKEWEEKLSSVSEEVLCMQQNNKKLDEKIVRLNVDRCELELNKEYDSEARFREFKDTLVRIFAKRSAVARKLLSNYDQILKMRKQLKIMICHANQPSKFTIQFHDIVE